MSMESHFLRYDFKTGIVASIADGGPYDSPGIGAIGLNRSGTVFHPVQVVCCPGPKCDY